jgi:hypothetical protein
MTSPSSDKQIAAHIKNFEYACGTIGLYLRLQMVMQKWLAEACVSDDADDDDAIGAQLVCRMGIRNVLGDIKKIDKTYYATNSDPKTIYKAIIDSFSQDDIAQYISNVRTPDKIKYTYSAALYDDSVAEIHRVLLEEDSSSNFKDLITRVQQVCVACTPDVANIIKKYCVFVVHKGKYMQESIDNIAKGIAAIWFRNQLLNAQK